MSENLVRVSDADREHAVASLREHLVQGRLSLEEFTQRMTAAYDATTSTDLAALQRDLPETAPELPERRRSALRFLVAIFGGAKRSGALRVQPSLVCVAVFGGVTLDLRGALIEGDEVRVQAFAAFGGIDVIVPEGVEVDLTGLALFGAKETRGKSGTLRPGAPLVRVNALVLFGGTTVRVKASK
jgi:Domain of unknown function (DUF1707)/Cell wall-active antibiotics response 4TMS YvqF